MKLHKLDSTGRRLKITELIHESGFFRSSELSKLLGVSEMTIRRDINRLAKNGLVETVHGGAKAIYPRTIDYSFHMRLEKNKSIKQSLARKALSYVEPNSIIGLDAGTTILELARSFPNEISLTVITYSLPIMTQLSNRENIELIGLGGVFRHNTQAFVGPLAHLVLNELRLSTLFLGTKAIQGNALYSGNLYDAEIKRALINVSDKVILLADSTKFKSTAGIRVADFNDIDVFIVDDGIDISNIEIPPGVELVIEPIENIDT